MTNNKAELTFAQQMILTELHELQLNAIDIFRELQSGTLDGLSESLLTERMNCLAKIEALKPHHKAEE
jgi:hypothetical protein